MISEKEQVPPEFWQGVAQFNQRQFYACHDILEALWMEAAEPQRTFYQGVLQIAVGLYHLSNQNWRGACILLGEGMGRLRYYQPDYAGVKVDELLEQSSRLLSILQEAGPERVAEFSQLFVNADEAKSNNLSLLELTPPMLSNFDINSGFQVQLPRILTNF